MTFHDRFPIASRSSHRGAAARRVRAQHRLALESLESRQLLAASVTNTLSVDINPAVQGNNVTFTALIAPSDHGTPTGQVTFQIDGTDQTPVNLQDVGGQEEATFSINTLTAGGHVVTAAYGGDPNYAPATSNSLLELVDSTTANVNSTTTISASPNPAVVGDSVTFTATVAPGNAGTPTGQVVFTIDGQEKAPVDLQDVGGQEQATFTTSSLAQGAHTVTAAYTGDATYLVSTSTPLNEQIEAATTTTLTSSANPSTAGDNVTFTAVVNTTGTGTPTGQLTLTIDGTSYAPADVTTLGGGQIGQTFALDTLSAGNHDVSVSYSGDTNFASSASSTLVQVVDQATTTTTLSSSQNPSIAGDGVTFTAIVTTTAASGAGMPGGQVTFNIDGTDQMPVSLQNVGGQEVANFTIATLTVGTHTVTATYNGNTNFAGSASAPLSQEVDQAATTTTLSSSQNPSTTGTNVSFTAVVGTNGGAAPTGQVTFNIDGVDQTPVDLADLGGGQIGATFGINTLGQGRHTVFATYTGDANNAGSSSILLYEVINTPTASVGTTTTLSSSSNTALVGGNVTFTAVVTPSDNNTPTGQVTFNIDGIDLASVAVTDLGGQIGAKFAIDTLPQGHHSVVATYDGDAAYLVSSSAPFDQNIQAATSTALTSSTNPSTVGDSDTFTAIVTTSGTGTPSGHVTFNIGGTDQTPVNVTDLGSGQIGAKFTINTLAVGNHDVIATYSGDDSFAGSASSTLTQEVDQATTTTALSSSKNPATIADSVTFTAVVTITATGAGTPSGQVTFNVDGTDETPVNVTDLGGGQIGAKFTIDTLSLGNHNVKASYSGDTNFAGSASSTLTQEVDQATSTTTLTTSGTPSTVGDSLIFTAIVTTNGTGTPSGQVTFNIDGTDRTPVNLTNLGGGQIGATFSISTLSIGNHNVKATYSGDTNTVGSASNTLTQEVDQATTTTTLSSSQSPTAIGTSVTFKAVVATAATGAGTPSGQVTLTIDGVAQTPINVTDLGGGQLGAAFTTSTLGLGTHTVTASYGGDASFQGSASSTLTQGILTDAQAGAPTLAPQSQTGTGSGLGYTKDNGSAAAPLVLAIPNPSTSLYYRLYDVTNAATPVLLAGPVQLSGGQITVNGHTLQDNTYRLAYTTSDSPADTASALSQAGTFIVQTSLNATINPSGNFLTVMPNNQVVITFDHWLSGFIPDQADGSGFASDPFAVALIPSGPDGKMTQQQTGSLWSAPNGVDGGDLPVPATLVYHQNADHTSTITLTARQPLASDVYLISVSGNVTDLAGNKLTLTDPNLPNDYSSFALRPTPADSTPLQVVSVTTNHGTVAIHNNQIPQPDTIAVHFNKPLDLWTANDSTVQLWQRNANGTYQRMTAKAIYSPSTNSVYLTPGDVLVPGTVYVVTVYSGISDDQMFPNLGNALAQSYYTTFTVATPGVGAGQLPRSLTVAATSPADMAVWTSRLGYGSVTFSEPINLATFGRYSAMLKPQTGGVTTGGSGYADVPYNAKLAFNPNTNQLMIVPTGILTDNVVDLFALSDLQATNGDPLTNPGGTLPVYTTFKLDHGAQPASAHAALTVGQPTVAGTIGAIVTTDDTTSQPAASTAAAQTHTAQPPARHHRNAPAGPHALAGRLRHKRHHG